MKVLVALKSCEKVGFILKEETFSRLKMPTFSEADVFPPICDKTTHFIHISILFFFFVKCMLIVSIHLYNRDNFYKCVQTIMNIQITIQLFYFISIVI
jgi:hypothetical protein